MMQSALSAKMLASESERLAMSTLSNYCYERKYLASVEEASHYAVNTVADGSKRIKWQGASNESA
jgi:hypothetical protein